MTAHLRRLLCVVVSFVVMIGVADVVTAAPAVGPSADAAAPGVDPRRISGEPPAPAPSTGEPLPTDVVLAPPVSKPAPGPASISDVPAPKPVETPQKPAPLATRTLSGFDPVKSVEDPSKRDALSRTWKNADGTETVQVSSMPLHFRDAKGAWSVIDNTVVDDGRGRLTNKANDWRVTFDVMRPGGGVSFTTPDGPFRFNALGASPVTPTVEPDGSSVRYVDVFPGTDLVYKVTGAGIEELLVLKTPAAKPSVTFDLNGVQFDRVDGQLKGRGTGLGKRVSMSTPETFDAKGRAVDVANQVFDVVDAPGNATSVTIGLTPEYVASAPADAFPLIVDPSVTVAPATSQLTAYATNMTTGAAYTAPVSDGYARVGNPAIGGTNADVRWRSVFEANYAPWYGVSVVDAYVQTLVDSSTNSSGLQPLYGYWADEWGPHFSHTPRELNSPIPPSIAYSNVWSNYFASELDSSLDGIVTHTGSDLDLLYNTWTRLSYPGGALLFHGSEPGNTYTLKKFQVSLYLTINRWPQPPTSTVSSSGRTITWSSANAVDDDGDFVSYRYRAWLDANLNGVYDAATDPVAGANGDAFTNVTSGSVIVPQSWSGQTVHRRLEAYDGIASLGEIHITGTEQGTFVASNTAPPQSPLVTPVTGSSSHNFTQLLTATAVTDVDADPVTYRFFQCTTSNCVGTKTYLSGWNTVPSANVTFSSPFYGQQLWWGVDTSDGLATTQSLLNTFTFSNAAPTATNVAPPNGTIGASTASQKPTLGATLVDNDDLVINYRFELTPIGGSGILAASPWQAANPQPSLGAGTSVAFVVPDWLESSVGYTWKVLVKDTNGATGASSPWSVMARGRLGADPTSPMQSVGGMQANLATGNLFFTAGSAKSVATVGGPLSVAMAYNSQDRSMLGLRGTYYVDANANNIPDTGEVKLVRVDSTPVFNWSSTVAPSDALQGLAYKVQWTGTMRVPSSGDWQFAGGHDGTEKITIVKNGGAPTVVYNSSTQVALGVTTGLFTGSTITLSTSDLITVTIDYTHPTTGAGWVEFRANQTSPTPGERQVDDSWFSSSSDQVLPQGWNLSADTGLDPAWTKAERNEGTVTLTAVDGSQTVWTRTTSAVSGAQSWVPPAEVDDTLAVNADGTITVQSGDGLIYQFATNGSLSDVTTAADDLKPAGGKRVYDPGTITTATPRLIRLEDRIASTRWIKLYYNQPGLSTGCVTPPGGFDTVAPAGMLCAIEYPDNTKTNLYYSGGMLARISDPGDETTAIGATAAPEGRAVTDMVWSNGKLASLIAPSDNDRNNAQNVGGSTIPVGERIPTAELRTDVTWNSDAKVWTVTLPRPQVGQARPAYTVEYPLPYATRVAVAGISGYVRGVTFDLAGRTLTDADAVGRTTTTTWAAAVDAVLRTVSGGRTTSTVYDAGWHPLDSYGPAPSSCFTTTAPPSTSEWASYPPNGSCPNGVPHTHTDYDTGLQGVQGAYWTNNTFAAATAGHGMGPNASSHIDYSWPNGTNPPGVTNADNWSARFTGLIYPPSTGNYVFRVISGATDTATVYLNDVAQLGTIPGTSDTSTGTITLNSTAPIRLRIDFKAGTGTSTLRFGWGFNGGATNFAVGANIKPGFWYPTRTTTDDTTGSSQVPAQWVNETRYNEGIDPVYGIATSTIADPSGQALKTVQGFETPGAGSLLRRTTRTLPAFAAAPTTANSTSYSYYPVNPTVGYNVPNPCVAGSASIDQGGMLKTRTTASPATGTAVQTEQVYDIFGRVVASRYVGETSWTCSSFDARGRATTVTIPAFSSTPARTVTTTYQSGGDPYKTTTTDPAGTITTIVDALGRTVKTIDVWGVSTTSSYDQAGRLTTAVTTTTGGYTSTSGYTYDTVNRLTQQSLDSKQIATLTYTSDTATLDPGTLSRIDYPPAGASSNGNGTYGSLTYDTLGRITGLSWSTTANTLITSDTVTRSLTGKVLTDKVDGAATPTWSYTYDAVGRLTRTVGSGHDYQYGYATTGGCGVSTAAGKNSNRTTVTDNAVLQSTYCYDNADRLTAITGTGATTPTYDTHGNTITSGGQTLGWDGANRNTSILAANGDTVTYTRDAANRIVSRNVTAAGATGTITPRTPGTTATSATTSLTVTKPTGTVQNDLMVAAISTPDTVGSGTTVKNWNFDTSSLDGWGVWATATVALSTAQAHSGTTSMQLTSTDPWWGGLTDTQPGRVVTAGTTYTFSGWVRAAQTGTDTVQLNVQWVNSGWGWLTSQTVGTVTPTNSGWSQITGSFTAPTGAAYALMQVVANGTGTAGRSFYIDDITITSGTGATTVTVTPPAGWTAAVAPVTASGVSTRVYTRLAGASEPASWVFTLNTAAPSTAVAAAYTGVDTATNIDTTNTAASSTAVAPHSLGQVTTNGANRQLIAITGVAGNTTFTANSTGFTQRGTTASTGTGATTIQLADKQQTTTGPSGPITSTTAAAGTDATITLALKPTGGSSQTTRYAYTGPGDNSAITLDQTGTVLERTLTLPGGTMLTTRSTGNIWSYPNIHGDVTAITNAAGTKQGATYTYNPYGQPLAGTPDNSNGALDYGWLGQHQRPTDTNTAGLIQMGARPYDPGSGRFLAIDPIEGGTTTNDYGYVPDPIGQFDLNGQGCRYCPSIPTPGQVLNSVGSGLSTVTEKVKKNTIDKVDININAGCWLVVCGSVGLNGGKPYVTGGYGFALALPGIGVSPATKQKCGKSTSNNLFVVTPIGVYDYAWEGQNMRKGHGSPLPGVSKNVNWWGRASGLGGGFVRQTRWQSC